ncbi:hypothetical protein BP5796_04893 [Coleophoma crateriformis]|uniref:Aminotransferase class I/classII large domain-containing protein n=1 Tax=Coleophoma crateriformis TaxID=565419 RepID=A0A3D8SAK4_9HELO|nr:hypothetical protein BP5796_04893 [Coleophoma crateriformis]
MMHLPLINLQLGWPSRELLPASALAQAATDSMADYELACSALLYGPGLGNTPLRQAVAQWLSEVYAPAAGDIPVERISISGGASQNVANLLQVFTDAGFTRHVWMIEPVYHLASKIFEDAGFQGKLRGVPEDAEGCDVGYLRARLLDVERERQRSLLRTGEDDRPQFKTGALYPKIYKHVIYCVPTFSNPSAKTMSLRRREQLLCLAREFDALIITDDCYDVLRWPKNQGVSSHELGPLPPRLVDLDRTLPGGSEWGNTVSNGTFSKLVGPGIRVGWMESTSLFALGLVRVGSTSSGGNPSQFTSTLVAQLLQKNILQDHIQQVLIPTYIGRYHSLMNAIEKYLVPLEAKVDIGESFAVTLQRNTQTIQTEEAGGFFTYITLPSDLPDTKVLAARALAEYNLKLAFGELFQVRGDGESGKRPGREFDHSLRLCWAWEENHRLEAGIRRLADLILKIRRERQ